MYGQLCSPNGKAKTFRIRFRRGCLPKVKRLRVKDDKFLDLPRTVTCGFVSLVGLGQLRVLALNGVILDSAVRRPFEDVQLRFLACKS